MDPITANMIYVRDSSLDLNHVFYGTSAIDQRKRFIDKLVTDNYSTKKGIKDAVNEKPLSVSWL